MPWYYASNGNQVGPVSDFEFQDLVNRGIVVSTTLVWRAGMAEWQPYSAVAPNIEAESTPAALEQGLAYDASDSLVACSVCGNVVPATDVIALRGAYVCGNCKPMYVQRLKEGAPLPGVYDYGGFWIRFVAKFLDGLILGIVTVPLYIGLFVVAFSAPGGDIEAQLMFQALQLLLQLVFIAINAVYATFFIGKYQATPGKMICGLIVIRPDGQRLTYMRAFGRTMAEIVSGMVCYIGYIMAAFDDEKRALHDYMCDTRVVRK